jgi:phosphoribosylformylglycinamidine cyclo-ligase
LDRHDTIGYDLVGMVVDDLVVCGAEPLFMTDYIACGKVDPARIATIVQGDCHRPAGEAGCALLGGETAEHPVSWDPTNTTSRVRRPVSWSESRFLARSASQRAM